MTPRHKQLGRGGPTGIFPAEVWEVVLEKLEKIGGDPETETGLNIINASTHLQETFQKEKALLALKKVIRFLHNNRWIDFHDLLNLRRVSKGLNRSIHAQINETKQRALFEAYNPDKHGPGLNLRQLRMDRKLDFTHCDPDSGNFVGFQLRKNVGVILEDEEFEVEEDPPSKLQADLQHLTENAPYVPVKTVPLLVLRSAVVNLAVYYDYDSEEDVAAEQLASFRNQLEFVFRRIGIYVWSLSFRFWFEEYYGRGDRLGVCSRVWDVLLEVLPKLENLRHLTIDGRGAMFHEDEVKKERNFPDLPNLESIKVVKPAESYSSIDPVLDPLIAHYSTQLRRLSVPGWCTSGMEPERFGRLTELEITTKDDVMSMRESEGTLHQFLDNLDAPLVRLQIHYGEDNCRPYGLTLETEVLHWLEKFPKLQSLEVISGLIPFREKESQNKKEFPNLKYLKMEDGNGGLTFQFLRRLPGLQYFHLIASPFPAVWDDSVGPDIRFKKELEEGRIYSSNIWGVLPELKTVTVTPAEKNERATDFCRERYERLKLGRERLSQKMGKGNGDGEDKPEMEGAHYYPLRVDIQEFLEAIKIQDEETRKMVTRSDTLNSHSQL